MASICICCIGHVCHPALIVLSVGWRCWLFPERFGSLFCSTWPSRATKHSAMLRWPFGASSLEACVSLCVQLGCVCVLFCGGGFAGDV